MQVAYAHGRLENDLRLESFLIFHFDPEYVGVLSLPLSLRAHFNLIYKSSRQDFESASV
jgi:hypothetical protein